MSCLWFLSSHADLLCKPAHAGMLEHPRALRLLQYPGPSEAGANDDEEYRPSKTKQPNNPESACRVGKCLQTHLATRQLLSRTETFDTSPSGRRKLRREVPTLMAVELLHFTPNQHIRSSSTHCSIVSIANLRSRCSCNTPKTS